LTDTIVKKSSKLSSGQTMNTDYTRYAERAKSAVSPADRTVSMLGMLCAAAAEQGEIIAFVGRGYGSHWPDPRIGNDRTEGGQSAQSLGFGPNFPGVSE
jgi:hypothetical protein